MDTVFILLFLNSSRNNGWVVDTIFSHFPSVEEILDHSCLESSNPNDVEMAKKLVKTKAPHRFIYKGGLKFFECMIIEQELGKPLNLYEYLHTGYADMNEECQIEYKSNNFIEEKGFEVGDHVVTSIEHSCLRGTMIAGTKVTITEIDPVRGYGIVDEEGNQMIEIGWVI